MNGWNVLRNLRRSSANNGATRTAAIMGLAGVGTAAGTYFIGSSRDEHKLSNSSVTAIMCEKSNNSAALDKAHPILATTASMKKNIPSSPPGTKLLFLGSGSSTGCPSPICTLAFPEDTRYIQNDAKVLKLQKNLAQRCRMSKIASMGDPKTNKNYRNNPSLLISHKNHDDEKEKEDGKNQEERELRNVIIDVGKTFREGAIRWMPHHGIFGIDGIVLTHEHADAMLGLDDLREFQKFHHQSYTSNALPIYLSYNCLEYVKKSFSYLVPKNLDAQKEEGVEDRDTSSTNHAHAGHLPFSYLEFVNKSFSYLVPKNRDVTQNEGLEDRDTSNSNNGTNKKVVRHVASLDFQVVEHFKPFIVAGLKMIPLPVIHGEDFICNGYAFSVKGSSKHDNKDDTSNVTNVVYLSDISRMIPETETFILEQLPPTDILVVDSLMVEKRHPVHFSLEQALEVVDRLKPKRTFIVGINCDDFPDHDEANKMIAARNPSVQLAHDGLAIEL